MPYWTAVSCNS